MQPKLTVAHDKDSSSIAYFSLNTSGLLYETNPINKSKSAVLKVTCNLYDSFETTTLYDSTSTIIKEQNQIEQIDDSLRFAAKRNNKYLLEVIFYDINSHQSKTLYYSINKLDYTSRQNFIIQNRNTILYSPYIKKNELIQLTYLPQRSKPKPGLIYGRYYNREFPLAAPPFSVDEGKPFNYKADSLFTLPLDASQTVEFSLPKKGIYHLQIDTATKTGYTLYNFGDKYPKVHTIDELAPPLRYVTTRREYNAILANENVKNAIDQFWLGIASTKGRAKELIRHYYTRVQDANRFFSSYMDGWRTDRGLIYIVFGPPNIIYKSDGGEAWIYGEENNFMSVNFNFTKVDNPFSDNDFQLNRSPIYKGNYYKAVDSWREGRIYVNK